MLEPFAQAKFDKESFAEKLELEPEKTESFVVSYSI